MHPKNISIEDYSYSLPDGRIAHFPLAERDSSKLLFYNRGIISEDIYRNIADALPLQSLLVFNNTRVIQARLLFQKSTGGVVEIFCLEPADRNGDISTAMLRQGNATWKCLVGGASKWKHGQVLEMLLPNDTRLNATYISKGDGHFIIGLTWSPPQLSFSGLLHIAGAIPLPPYIKRKASADDSVRYQTVYAQSEGSVAAPTAGLHFTPAIFDRLSNHGIDHSFVTLHVGAGTFQPVKSKLIGEHEMHAEFIDVSTDFIGHLLLRINDPIIAVGTTSLRTIESLYWLGVKWKREPPLTGTLGELLQWEAYDSLEQDLPVMEALQCLLDCLNNQQQVRLIARTQIIIAPGYRFRIINGLVTNFHQPRSTLLLLIAALIGKDWEKVYAYALEHDFRFLSYGDGCLLLPGEGS